MMANLNGFDASQIEPTAGRDPLPAGKYLAAIVGSEFKPTKAGTGQYLELKFQVLEGPHKDRLLWARLNLDNPNEQAVEIAKGELAEICRAVSVLQPQDSVDLHDLPLLITVKCKKRDDNGEIANEISGYAKKPSPPPPDAPAAGTSSAPWMRS
ncbi:MAG: DUF669 domain-containing protein [Planctomycetaceae bacterium]